MGKDKKEKKEKSEKKEKKQEEEGSDGDAKVRRTDNADSLHKCAAWRPESHWAILSEATFVDNHECRRLPGCHTRFRVVQLPGRRLRSPDSAFPLWFSPRPSGRSCPLQSPWRTRSWPRRS